MSGGAGYTTYFRALDPRIGRWLTPDPKVFPWQSPYVSMDGNPIALIDPWGASTDGPDGGGDDDFTTGYGSGKEETMDNPVVLTGVDIVATKGGNEPAGVNLSMFKSDAFIPTFEYTGSGMDYVNAVNNAAIGIVNSVPATWNLLVDVTESIVGGEVLDDLAKIGSGIATGFGEMVDDIKSDPLGTLSNVGKSLISPQAIETYTSSIVGLKIAQSSVTKSAPKPKPNPVEAATTKGGRLGNATTRSQIDDIATTLESRGYTITGGGQRGLAEEYLKPLAGGRKGGSYIDITADHSIYGRLRINTVDVLKDGISPTTRELRNATRIRTQIGEGEHLLLIPKR